MAEKIRKTFRVSEYINTCLSAESETTGRTQNGILEEALLNYFTDKKNEYEKIADLFLQRYEEKYTNWMAAVQLGVKAVDISSQVGIEIFNTMLMAQQYSSDFFVSTQDTKHPIIINAEKTIAIKFENLCR